jgi:NADH-quinone oxidoreductase subunit E
MDDTKRSAPPNVDVAVVDDEESIREGCRQALEASGYRTASAGDGAQALKLIESERPRVLLLDLRMPGLGGLELLEKLPKIDPRIVPIVITGYGTVDSAVSAMKLGAFDFINKPFDVGELIGVVERGLGRWTSFAPAPPVRAAKKGPAAAPKTEADVLLAGLQTLEDSYKLGVERSHIENELHALEAEAGALAGQLGRVQEKEQAIHALADDLRLVDSIIARHQFKKNALIQILLELQAAKSWLPRHCLAWVERRLGIPMARILEVATFYEAFSLTPQGRHLVQVCTGTACHVRHAPELSAMVQAVLKLKPGETDPNLHFTLKQVGCLGCCALAPVIKVDDQYHSNPSLGQLDDIFAGCRAADEGA